MQYINDLIFIFGYGALAFVIAMVGTPIVIKLLQKWGWVKTIRETAMDGKSTSIFSRLHAHKSGTPNGGGIVIWGSVLLVILISRLLSYFGLGYYLEFDGSMHSILNRTETWLPVFTLVVTALLGLLDDYLNVKGHGKVKGISHKPKFFWLTIFALIGALWFHYRLGWSSIHVPSVGDFDIGWWYIPLFTFVIISCANAVNFTDGLDGLAGGLLAIAFTAFAVLSYAYPNASLGTDHMVFLSTFCVVIAGALVGFLWYNVNPAKLFMGDTGSLSLGATLGVIAMLNNAVIVLGFIGILFFLELASSAIQLFSKKYFNRKIFKSAPFHHHLQAIGLSETNIVMRMWIVGAMFAVVGVIIGLIGMGDFL